MRMAWMLVAAWTAVIYTTIPFARVLQKEVAGSRFGSEAFQWGVIAILVLVALGALRAIVRMRASVDRYLWLGAVTAIFAWYTLSLKSSPEEAVHFVQYGVLGVLIYRALAHSISDPTIWITAVSIGASIGILDEVIQWLTPERYWDLRDIWLNFFGVALTMIGLAFGIRPSGIRPPVTAKGIRWLCRSAAIALLLLGTNLVNTPDRFRFAFIEAQSDQMVEYGHRHEDPEIGVFQSRFSLEELKRTDEARSEEAAAILDQYATGEKYAAFLSAYPAPVDPFLHEMRVHIFRRDHYARVSALHAEPESKHDAGIAVRENQILEKYFGKTLAASTLKWTEQQLRDLTARANVPSDYVSPVSSQLFTRFSEVQLVAALALAWLGLLLLYRRSARSPPHSDRSRP
jgi:hypothetical protein